LKVLVIDDDPQMVKAVEMVIKELKCIVSKSYSGEDALKKVKKNLYDLIIVDLILPGIHGLEFIRMLRKTSRYFSVPVLLMTGNMSQEDAHAAISAGANDLLVKPFEVETLQQKMKALIQID